MQKHWTCTHIIYRNVCLRYIWPWRGSFSAYLLLLATLDLLLPASDLLSRLLRGLLLFLHVSRVLTHDIIQIVHALVQGRHIDPQLRNIMILIIVAILCLSLRYWNITVATSNALDIILLGHNLGAARAQSVRDTHACLMAGT